MRGHGRAITELAADAAGRYFFSGSSGDRAVIIWDGLTFKPHKVFNDVSVASMALGTDALLLSSFKPPYLHIWNVKQYSGPSVGTSVQSVGGQIGAYMTSLLTDRFPYLEPIDSHTSQHTDQVSHAIKHDANESDNQSNMLSSLEQMKVSRNHHYTQAWQRLRHEAASTKIVTTRTAQWCYQKLRGDPVHGFSGSGIHGNEANDKSANQEINSLQVPKYVDEREEAEVVTRWLSSYHRQEADIDFYPPKGATNSTYNTKSLTSHGYSGRSLPPVVGASNSNASSGLLGKLTGDWEPRMLHQYILKQAVHPEH